MRIRNGFPVRASSNKTCQNYVFQVVQHCWLTRCGSHNKACIITDAFVCGKNRILEITELKTNYIPLRVPSETTTIIWYCGMFDPEYVTTFFMLNFYTVLIVFPVFYPDSAPCGIFRCTYLDYNLNVNWFLSVVQFKMGGWEGVDTIIVHRGIGVAGSMVQCWN